MIQIGVSKQGSYNPNYAYSFHPISISTQALSFTFSILPIISITTSQNHSCPRAQPIPFQRSKWQSKLPSVRIITNKRCLRRHGPPISDLVTWAAHFWAQFRIRKLWTHIEYLFWRKSSKIHSCDSLRMSLIGIPDRVFWQSIQKASLECSFLKTLSSQNRLLIFFEDTSCLY